MASSSRIHSAPVSASRSYKYDIFLSFRGEDTRKTFVDHLYAALEQHLICVYKDDEKLPRGESIRPSLYKAIEESRLAIIIFSKHYADSSWCLDELVHIMKCREERELIVMPVFYDVDPSDVRKQKEDFGIAFSQQEAHNISKTTLWRSALVDAGNIAGWEPKHIANGHESKVITEIVESALGRLFPLNIDVDEGLVGMTSRLKDLKSQLDIGSGGVRMVGIWGCGGSGKTTLATSVYMEIRSLFQGYCIVENIREESSKAGLKKLQETILSAVLKMKVTVCSVAEGKHMIKTMLCNRNVLIVLDDVNHLDQLDALAGLHSWFGNGSRIIITTRDEHLLKTHLVDRIYHARLLSDDEATQLFNWHAYNEIIHIEDYETLSSSVVSYAAGLPLALKVLGSFLYDKEKKMWMDTLDRLKDIPEMEIMEKLKISYDGLKNIEKGLFLDVACFWRRKKKNEAVEILEACGFHPEIGIEVLRQKALIYFDLNGSFEMHDLVQEMGHYIVREERSNNPEKHSRLWKREEIKSLYLTMENEMIEAIEYDDYFKPNDKFFKSVSNMKRLRYIKVRMMSTHDEELNFLSNELRYIEWDDFRVTNPFADSFKPMNLVVLKLSYSKQTDLWKGCKHLPHLKVLHLELMLNLLSTPDFKGLPCLQKLKLVSCPMLEEIHPSLANHTSLQYVHVISCQQLRMFPTIVHMENLMNLGIRACPRVQGIGKSVKQGKEKPVKTRRQLFTQFLGKEKPVKTRLQLFNRFLFGLQMLDLGASHFKDVEMPSGPFHINKEIPSGIVKLSNLQELSLAWNDFSRIDFSLVQFTQLKLLNLLSCEKLLELPELPSSLIILNANGCSSLTSFGDCFKNCTGLCQVSIIGGVSVNDGERLLASMLEACTSKENCPIFIKLEGAEIAKGLHCLNGGRGSRCRLQLQENWRKDFSGFLMWGVFTSDSYTWNGNPKIRMSHVISGMDSKDDVVWVESDGVKYKTRVWYVPFGSLRHTTWWDQSYNALEILCYDDCCGFGVKLVDMKSRSALTETLTYSSTKYTPQIKINERASDILISLYWYGENDF